MEDRTNPSHYKDEAVEIEGKRYEPIDLCECYCFCLGNALKYILRSKHHKDGEKLNLEKALWYLKRLKQQDYLNYTVIYPEGDGRHHVPCILSVYRERFDVVAALFEPSGMVSIVNIDNVIMMLERKIQNLEEDEKCI